MPQLKKNFYVLLVAGFSMLMFSLAKASTTIMAEIEQTGLARVIVHIDQGEGYEKWSRMVSSDEQKLLVKTAYNELADELAVNGIRVDKSYSTLPFFGTKVNEEQLEYLKSLDGVAGIYPVLIERKTQAISGPELKVLPAEIKPTAIDISETWLRGYEGAGQSIAIIDGGFYINHPMLKNKAIGDACFSAAFGGDTFSECPKGQSPQIEKGAASNCAFDSSRCDHGTHVASLAVGNDGLNFGVARGANFVPVDVFSKVTNASICFPDPTPCQLTDSLAILDALNYVNEKLELYNIGVVNLSIGGGAKIQACDDDPRKFVINMLQAKGVITVSSAGNQGLDNAINAPACISNVVAVGALDDDGLVSSFSNFGPLVNILAPGENIYSANTQGGFTARSGTSMSSAIVAGAFAVIKSAVPLSNWKDIKSAVSLKGAPVGRTGLNYSIPRLKVNESILYLQSLDTDFVTNVNNYDDSFFMESKLSFYNSSSDEGAVVLQFFDSKDGEFIGSWNSELIPPNSSRDLFLRDVSFKSTDAEVSVGSAFNVFVESDFEGGVQYLLLNAIDETVVNLTSCRDHSVFPQKVVPNVYPLGDRNFSSILLLYNSGDEEQDIAFDVFNGSTGEALIRFEGQAIKPGSSYEITSDDLELATDVDRIKPGSYTSQLSRLTVKFGSNFTGHVQHLVKNKRSNAITEFSERCSFKID